MELAKYDRLKKQGIVTVAKIGKGYVFSKKIFSSDTGLELDPEVGAIDLKQLENEKTKLKMQISNIDQIINDCQALG